MNLFIDLKGDVMRVSPQRTSRIIFVISVTLLTLLLIGSLSAHAATIAVTTTTDELTTPGTGCSLREAIQNINNGAATIYPECPDGAATGFGVNDTINVPAGTYTITIAPDTTPDDNADGDFDISKAVAIIGAGETTTIIQAGTSGYPNVANGIDKVFQVTRNVAVAFNSLTIRNGYANVSISIDGGAIVAVGALTLTNVTISGNRARLLAGGVYAVRALTMTNTTITNNASIFDSYGGFYSGGALIMTNSTVSNNAARICGGFCGRSTVEISGSTISGNSASIAYGGFYSVGSATVTGSTVSGNKATAGDFGGIFVDGALTVTDSTISGNTARNWYGGIRANSTLKLINSTVSGNTAQRYGGIWVSGALTLTNSTVSGNSATAGDSGGIYAFGAVTLNNSTIYGNSAVTSGGGVYGFGGAGLFSMTATNSIIANNTGGDCFKTGGTFTSNGYNIDSDNTCNLVGIGDQPNTTVATLNLAALANNGGPTQTHALLAGSPAIDTGTCINPTDQRGIARPQGVTCDIGAYELEQYMLTVTVSGAGVVTGGTGIDCPSTLCSEIHLVGDVATLTAIASSGETFTGWGGDCAAAGTATTCTVTMSAVKTVSASFGGYGCTDPTALNYNPNATIDDGSCTYSTAPPPSGGGGGTVGNQPPTAGRHGDKWLHYPDNGDSIGPDTKFVWDELIDPDGDTVLYDLYICINGDFADCAPISVAPSYRTIATVGFGMTGALVIGFCFVGGVRTLRGRMLLTAALLVAGLTLSHCGNSSSSDGSTSDGGRFSCDGEDAFAVCYDSKGLAVGDYKWRVTASDGKGATNTSETRSFTVE